jgi:N-acetylneuraminate synthase
MSIRDYDAFTLQGEAREEALAACREQLAAWGLTMPPCEPIPFHFGLNDFYRIGEIEFWIANEVEAGYCGKFLFMFDGQTCPYHHHDVKHETFYVVKGRLRMKIDGEDREMKEGDVLAMDVGTDHSFTGLGPALLMEVSKPCIPKDSIFEDQGIGIL